jgi:hypothetical protein
LLVFLLLIVSHLLLVLLLTILFSCLSTNDGFPVVAVMTAVAGISVVVNCYYTLVLERLPLLLLSSLILDGLPSVDFVVYYM